MKNKERPIFKLRASKAGLFLVTPRSKTETLGAGAKSYLEEWVKEQIYGVKKEFYSPVTDKGNIVEDESIYHVIDWLDLPFYVKNDKHFEDDYFQGTPDGLPEGLVIDQKNSWDCFTFPLFEKECPEKDYYAQLQIYMELTGRRKALLVYTLLNTPDHLERGEAKNYEDLPVHLRNRSFEINYDPEMVQLLKERVIAAREYIDELYNFIENGFTK